MINHDQILLHLHSVKNTALVGWNHVFNVDESVLSSGLLQKLEGLRNQIAQVESLSLAVLDLVAAVGVTISKDIENWEDLSVVGDQGLTDHVSAQH